MQKLKIDSDFRKYSVENFGITECLNCSFEFSFCICFGRFFLHLHNKVILHIVPSSYVLSQKYICLPIA